MRDPHREVRRAAILLSLWFLLWSLGPIFGSETWFFGDLRHHYYPWRVWAARTWAEGGMPLWAPIGHGYPLLADGQAGVLYPVNIGLYMLLPEHLAFSWSIALHQVWAAVGAMVLARVQGRSAPAATVAGVAFGASGFLVSHMVYLPMFQVIAWVPWMAAAAWRAVEHGGRWWVAAGLATGLAWLCGHPQLALYATWTAVFVAGWRAVELRQSRGWSPLLGLGIWALIAGVIALPQLWATLELVALGHRAGGVDATFAAMGALPPEELVNGVLPSTFGFERPADIALSYHHRAGGYAGRGVSYLEDTFYLGVTTVLMALAAGRSRRAWLWWALGGLAVLVMLGPATPFFHVYRLLPGAEGLRFPVRAAVVLTLAFSQLGALGVDRLSAWLYARHRRVERRALLVLAGGVLALTLASGASAALRWAHEPARDALAERLVRPEPPPEAALAAVPPPPGRGIEQATIRAEEVLAQVRRSVNPLDRRVFWPVGATAVLAFLWLLGARGRVPPTLPGRITWVVLAIDLTVFAWDFNPTTPIELVNERPASAVPLLGVPGPFRIAVLDRRGPADLDTALLSSNLGLMWGAEDVIVPTPLRPLRTESYLERVGLDLGLTEGEEQVRRFRAHRHLADLSGVRFLFTTHALDLPDLDEVFAEEHEGATVRVYENRRALNRAFAVGCTRSVGSGVEALEAVASLDDPAAVAVVEGEGLASCTPGPVGTVSTVREGTADLVVEADLEREAWLVLTESPYPGQVLTVDGEPVATTRTDHLFQGVRLSAGVHRLEWAYLPLHLLLTMLLSTIAYGAAAAFLTWKAVRARAAREEG